MITPWNWPIFDSTSKPRSERVQGQIAFAQRTPNEQAPAVVVPNYEHVPIVSYDVTIRDARPVVDELSLDREGFVLIQQKTSCANVRDSEIMRETYLEEMVPFIKSYFNASRVIASPTGLHLRRAAGTAIPKSGWKSVAGIREPAGLAHIDVAPISGPMRAAAEDQAQGLPIRAYSRLMLIQVWRALSPLPQDFPLAFCDASTIVDQDISVVDYGVNKSCVVRFNSNQRWYYFPE